MTKFKKLINMLETGDLDLMGQDMECVSKAANKYSNEWCKTNTNNEKIYNLEELFTLIKLSVLNEETSFKNIDSIIGEIAINGYNIYNLYKENFYTNGFVVKQQNNGEKNIKYILDFITFFDDEYFPNISNKLIKVICSIDPCINGKKYKYSDNNFNKFIPVKVLENYIEKLSTSFLNKLYNSSTDEELNSFIKKEVDKRNEHKMIKKI